MAHVNRRIGKSSETANPTADGTGGGVLDAFFHDYFRRSGNLTDVSGAAPVPAIQASGGLISEYTDSGDVYRAHVFTASGSLVVSDITSSFPTTAKILVVAGGGGGGGAPNWAGGGGAGGLLETTSFTLNQRTYPITIGGGGVGGVTNTSRGGSGGNTVFTDPGGPTSYTATGGGGGGCGNAPNPAGPGGDGGSGGGAGENKSGGSGTQGNASPFTGYGNDGGGSGGPNNGSGGGGAGSTAVNIATKYPGTRYVTGTTSATQPGPNAVGGDGRANTFAYGPTNPQSYAGGGGCGYFDWDGPGGPNLGSGQLNPDTGVSDMNTAPGPATDSGLGGGGKGGAYYQGIPLEDRNGTQGSGGGGGGGIQTGPRTPVHPNAPQPSQGGSGGSGLVVVAYQIGSTTSAKASGGAISRYLGKTIHTFTSSGTFTNTSGSNLTVDHIIIAGGGAGGGTYHGAGGGAGGVRTSIPGIMPATADSQVVVSPGSPNAVTVTIGAGAAGVYQEDGRDGAASSFGPLSATGGGGGGGGEPDPSRDGRAGGSGGGSGQGDTGGVAGGAANPNSNPSRQGYPGGNAGTHPGSGWSGAGGGGGAGGAGSAGDAATGSPNANTAGGGGGIGIQLPSTFRDPTSGLGVPGPNGEGYWFAGGGGGTGGGITPASAYGRGGTGTPGDSSPGPFAGGGDGSYSQGSNGSANTGGGGGGSERSPAPPNRFYSGGNGGSGIVIIAYDT